MFVRLDSGNAIEARVVGAGTSAAQAGLRPLDRVGVDNTVELTVERDGKPRCVRVRVIDLHA